MRGHSAEEDAAGSEGQAFILDSLAASVSGPPPSRSLPSCSIFTPADSQWAMVKSRGRNQE